MRNLLLFFFFACLVLSAEAQVTHVQGAFAPGRYYTPDGTKVEGLVRHSFGGTWGNAPDNYIDFKATPDDKPQRLTVQDINHFVIGQDSFTVKENFDINEIEHFDKDFMRVVKSGNINLYLHYSTIYVRLRKSVLTYFVEKDGELYRMVRPAQFKDQIPLLISDNKPLLAKVKNKEYNIFDLQTVVEEYNEWFEEKKKK